MYVGDIRSLTFDFRKSEITVYPVVLSTNILDITSAMALEQEKRRITERHTEPTQQYEWRASVCKVYV